MSDPFVGEIRMFAGTFAPLNWAFCNGQPVSIADNTTLFQLLGTTYGGDGVNTFNLPNLLSRVPIHFGTAPDGNTYVMGQQAGVEQVSLTAGEMPLHSHQLMATKTSQTQVPAANALPASATSAQAGVLVYGAPTSGGLTSLTGKSISVSPLGGPLPHPNIQPYQAINFIISLFGIFPSPN